MGRPAATAAGLGEADRERIVTSRVGRELGGRKGEGEAVLTRKLLRPMRVGLNGGVLDSDLGESVCGGEWTAGVH